MEDGAIAAHIGYLRLKGRMDNTITARLQAVARCQSIIGSPVIAATEADLMTWRAGMTDLADITVIQAMSHIRCYLNWAVKNGYRPDNPAADIPVPPMPDYEPRPISYEDLLTAVEGAPPRIRLWLVLASLAGMRCIEIALLRRSCVRHHDTPPRVIIRKDATKGKRKGRIIFLHPDAVRELDDYGMPVGAWMFPALIRRDGPVTAHTVSNLGNAYLHDRCGISDTMHSLRHFYGTELLDATGNLRLVQDQMGHADPETTALYTLVKDSKAAAAVTLLPGLPSARRRRAGKIRAIPAAAVIAATIGTAAAAPAAAAHPRAEAHPVVHVHRSRRDTDTSHAA
jgi:integrase